MNLIPSPSYKTPNYWCTWCNQNYVAKSNVTDYKAFLGEENAKTAREILNEDTIFSENGWASQFPQTRGELYFLLDDGWDVPSMIDPAKERFKFGSLILDTKKFPSCDGTPRERLKKLNDKVKEFGWRGLGIWVAAQPARESADEPLEHGIQSYWKERVLWSKFANIEYWKVDWGTYSVDFEFRKNLTLMAKEIYPELIIEHATIMGAFNGAYYEDKNTNLIRFEDNKKDLTRALEIHKNSEVFRTYDVVLQLSTPATLDRIAILLQNEGGILNAEDTAYLAVSLGCALGVQRSKFWSNVDKIDYDSLNHKNKINEIERAIIWQRFAPAFSGGEVNVSERILTDSWKFLLGDNWEIEDEEPTIAQSAPASVSRNLRVPKVSAENDFVPFVCASKHDNGCVSIATFARVSAPRKVEFPLADVELDIEDSPSTVGVFGSYKSLALITKDTKKARKIYIQDLIGETATDISDLVEFEAGHYIFSGDIFDNETKKLQDENDFSPNGLVVCFK